VSNEKPESLCMAGYYIGWVGAQCILEGTHPSMELVSKDSAAGRFTFKSNVTNVVYSGPIPARGTESVCMPD